VPSVQAKVRRALEERAVVPVGAQRLAPYTARVIAATNGALTARIQQGQFRSDLYAYLRQLGLVIPPLRARREDLLALFITRLDPPGKELSHALAEALLVSSWPYNVGELLAVARELSILGRNEERLEVGPFLEHISGRRVAAAHSIGTADTDGPPDRAELERLLREHHGVVAMVAKALGRSRHQVYRWIVRHEINLDKLR